ncbi:calcyphosin-2 isoform X2 [Latimeria chalumnae]|uniref:calcyphosin-2 isoform X2 n=1 Tax=Latimeria chalumnae TaxID=7897 RepID=UPI00313AF79B
MDLEIKGTAATPRGQSRMIAAEKKRAQGWRTNAKTSYSLRPADVPALDLGKLGDSDDEDANYKPLDKQYPRLGPPDTTSTVSWGTPIHVPCVQRCTRQQVVLDRGGASCCALRLKASPPQHESALVAWETHVKDQTSISQMVAQVHYLSCHQPPPWEEKTVPENLPAPSDKYREKYKQYEVEMKENYKQFSQRVVEKSKGNTPPQQRVVEKSLDQDPQPNEGDDDGLTALDEKALLQQCYISKPYTVQQSMRKLEADDLAAEKRKQSVVEQVMADQLSRAVISDPQQNAKIVDSHRQTSTLPGPGTAPLRFRNRTLHETKVKTSSTLTENLLSSKFRFDARILTRNGRDACRELIGFFFAFDNSITIYEYRHFGKNRSNALPFIQKRIYSHQSGRRKGKQYVIRDFYVGANLTFLTSEHISLPESIKQKRLLTIRITDVDEEAKYSLLDSSADKHHPGLSKQEIDDRNVFKAVQGLLLEKLKKRGVRTLTGLGKHFRQLDTSGDGLLQKAEFKKAMALFHLEVPEKAYMKLDPNKAGSVAMIDLRKFYCARKHPKVISGEVTEEQIKAAFVETLQEACSVPSEVSYCEFENYYEGLSVGILDDEDFANVLRNSWGI